MFTKTYSLSAGACLLYKITFLPLLIMVCLSTQDLQAQGNLLITPRRVILEPGSGSTDLNLANTGTDTATYAISLVQIRMTEEGRFETISKPDPGQYFADKHIRFFPRKVTLAPGEAQLVKVQIARRSELEEKEYRSHLYFRAVEESNPLGQEPVAKKTESISVSLKPVFGITIPVIIRKGDLSCSVTLSDIKIDYRDNKLSPLLEIVFNRQGSKSVYGNLTVNYIRPDGGKILVAKANGIAVYTPVSRRKFSLALSTVDGIDYSEGKLVIEYSQPPGEGAKTIASTELILQ